MNIKEHRLYSYMSEPVRVVGLTIDELVLGIFCLILFFVVEAVFLKALFFFLTPMSIFVVKKLKKLVVGFSLISFLHWHFGFRLGLSDSVPVSWKRKYWG